MSDRPGVRLLVSGDLHLGRHPSRVPPAEPGLDVETVWRSIIDLAIERRVDALVLTGDLADESNKYFEAYGVLERTLQRLRDADLQVVLVAGNHDYDVAGSVADQLQSPVVRCLGRGETWETATVERRGQPVLRLAGWSFAGATVRTSPLATFPADVPTDIPLVGVLHADLEAGADSRNAPVALADLWAAPVAAWLLGHVHAPRCIERDGRLVLYPGSPQPLDPGERGAHGAWLVEVAPDGTAAAEMVPLATLRYDDLDVALDGVETAEDARERVLTALRMHADEAAQDHPALRRCVVRLRLVGRVPAFRQVGAVADEIRRDGEVRHGDLLLSVDEVADEVRPALDLARLSAGSGPVATLAGLALRLDTDTLRPSDEPLLAAAAASLRDARRARLFDALAQNGLLAANPAADARRRLTRQVFRLLDEVLAQRAPAA